MATFTVETWTDSRSNRRNRTYRVDAPTADEARAEARRLAEKDVRQNVAVFVRIAP